MRDNKKFRLIFAIAAMLAACAGTVCLFFQRRRKGIFYALAAVLLFGVASVGAAVTVYAKAQDDVAIAEWVEPDAEATTDDNAATAAYPETGTGEVIGTITGEEIEVDIGDFITNERPPNILTPSGNLNLVDDIAEVQGNELQFITVTTRNGHFFYIIIDRAGERENVHFLNQVSEFDLLQILQGEDAVPPPLPTAPPTVTITPPQYGDPTDANNNGDGEEPAPQPRQSNNTQILLMLAVVALIGGGAFYYFKVLKPKQGNTKKAVAPVVDEFDFDPDEDDLFSDNVYTDTDDDQEDGADFMDDDEEMPDFTAVDDPADFTHEENDESEEK